MIAETQRLWDAVLDAALVAGHVQRDELADDPIVAGQVRAWADQLWQLTREIADLER